MAPIKNHATEGSAWNALQTFLDDVDTKLQALGQKAEAVAGEAQLKTHLGLMEADEFSCTEPMLEC